MVASMVLGILISLEVVSDDTMRALLVADGKARLGELTGKKFEDFSTVDRYKEWASLVMINERPMENFCYMTLGLELNAFHPGTSRTVLLTLAGEMNEVMPPGTEEKSKLAEVVSLRIETTFNRVFTVSAAKRVAEGKTRATVVDLKEDGSVVVQYFELEVDLEADVSTGHRFNWKKLSSGVSITP